MRIIDILIKEKRWLAYGSFSGGALGALFMTLNELVNARLQLTFGIQMGLTLTTALGMIGGMFGGAIGCFVGGKLAKEEIVMNLGESLGIGLVDGFLSGTSIGIIIGFAHRLKPEILSVGFILILMAIVIAITTLVFVRKKPSRQS